MSRPQAERPEGSLLLTDRAQVYLSALDEARFGIRTAKASALTAAALPDILAFCREERIRLLIARSTGMDFETMRACRCAGLELMDTLMCWVADLGSSLPIDPSGYSSVRAAIADDADEVRQVALSAFRGYVGHYHADPRLQQSACDEAYADWAYRSLAPGSRDHVLVTEVEGRIAGFASVRLRAEDEGEAVLSGVVPELRRRGLYRALHAGRMAWCRNQGARRIFSATLATNAVTQRAYFEAGYVPSHASYTFHKWFE